MGTLAADVANLTAMVAGDRWRGLPPGCIVWQRNTHQKPGVIRRLLLRMILLRYGDRLGVLLLQGGLSYV